ncbi:hypothetical protein [Blastococcus sp. Marseille-P5729]|uniref:hypothetical protein n=1 Tax=Blastococcus sp. Marseille-P5729 TaxID=2086582 RepID=UPI000D0FB726|nr:hypothetical protein [Blastococcus sp. Marseille-P5729]
MSARKKEPVDISQTDELGLTGSGRAVNIAAWVLSALVIIAGIVALVTTGKKIFILFIVIGVLTPLNVLMYDNLILKPKVARLKKERADQRAAQTPLDKEAEQ